MTQEIDLDTPDYEGLEEGDTVRFDREAIFSPHQAPMYHDGPYEATISWPEPDGAGDITVRCIDSSMTPIDVDADSVEVIDRVE